MLGVIFVWILALQGLGPSDLGRAETPSEVRAWDFDADSIGTLPQGFQAGTFFDGRMAGEWTVLA